MKQEGWLFHDLIYEDKRKRWILLLLFYFLYFYWKCQVAWHMDVLKPLGESLLKKVFLWIKAMNASEKRRATRWLHNIGTWLNVETFAFGRNKVVRRSLPFWLHKRWFKRKPIGETIKTQSVSVWSSNYILSTKHMKLSTWIELPY